MEGNVHTGGALLNRLSQKMKNISSLKIGLLDAAKFIGKFVDPIAYSPSHIYISALPFCSQNSVVLQWIKKVPSLPVVQLLQGTLDQPLLFQLHGHKGLVNSVSFSPDGRYIASGSNDQTVQSTLSHFHLYIASGSDDRAIHLWSVETGVPIGQPYEGHIGKVNSVSFSSDGKYIASGSDDLTVCLWSVETGMQVAQPYKGHIGKVNAVSFSPDGRYIVSGSTDHTVRLWNVENGMPVGEPYEGHTDFINTVPFSPDGRYIASGSDDQTIHLWSVDTEMPVAQPYEGHTDWVNTVSFPSDGRYISSGHTDFINSVSFSPDMRYIASSSHDQTVHLSSVETGMPVKQPYEGYTDQVNSVSFSPVGKYIASGSGNKTASAWNVEGGMQAVQPYEGHTGKVNSVLFSPDGKHIDSGSGNQTAFAWNVEVGMQAVQSYKSSFQMLDSYQPSPTSPHSLLLHEFPTGFFLLASNVKYILEWVPGASYKRQARVWKKYILDMAELPFQHVKAKMANGTVQSSLTSTHLETLAENKDVPADAEEVIKNTAAIIFAGGTETTVNTLKTFILSMILFPEAQKKAQEELDNVLEGARLPKFEDMQALPYTIAIYKETLLLLREEADFGPYTDKFDPGRFLEPGRREPEQLGVFSYGRCICPGRYMAENSLLITVASILQLFDISPATDSSGKEIPPEYEWTSGFFSCTIKPRSKAAEELILSIPAEV
ncbi:hypothetical protein M422DRAFT_249252 [Sphaerobolus stellatus SS14]|uniref:WD40 repeat-like protein n=1 Tax=Sphaerobolus stellatus (strain SS14) TaxID=990650 RepID=A0A0C9W5C1_SPHS4|nr:hypothetical protein M422DRAFT_249252 [Sphaerobolus stellatus SS14]